MTLKHLVTAMLIFEAIGIPALRGASKSTEPPPSLLSHELHADRSVTFRYKDAFARHIELNLEGAAKPIPMTRGNGGVWSFTTQPLAPEFYSYSFLVDGDPRIDPENHRVASNLVFPAGNVLLVPGAPPQPWEETGVPHGILHEHRFTSKVTLGGDVTSIV